MGDMTLPPRGCIRAGANVSLSRQKFGGHLLAIRLEPYSWCVRPPGTVGRRPERSGADPGRIWERPRVNLVARRLTKLPQGLGNFKAKSTVTGVLAASGAGNDQNRSFEPSPRIAAAPDQP